MKMISSLLGIAFLMLCGCVSSKSTTAIFPCSERLNNPYGIIAHLTKSKVDYPYLHKEVVIMKEIGINSVRLDFAASQITRSKDGYSTQIWDSVICALQSAKISILPILDRTIAAKPAWINVNGYKDYLNYTLGKYSKITDTWEMMNEADLYPASVTYDTNGRRKKVFDYAASGAGYMSKLPEFYHTIKTIAPSTSILLSGLASDKNGFFDTICVHGGDKYFDIMNIHCYLEPEQIPILLKRIKKKMDKYGYEKPIWITECGMHTAKNGEEWRTEEEQACRLPRIFLMAFAYGVDRVYWYNLRSTEEDSTYKEDNFGIIHADLSPKPAYYTYKALTAFCPNKSTRPSLDEIGDVYKATWVCPNGKKVTAVWAKKRTAITIQCKRKTKFYDYFGKRIKRPQSVGKNVIYIVGDIKSVS